MDHVRPKFINEFRFGDLVPVLGFILTFGSTAAYVVKAQTQLEERVQRLNTDLDKYKIEMNARETRIQAEIERVRNEAHTRTATYAPQIESLNRSQILQDERIANVIDSSKEIRISTNQILASLSEIKQDFAVMRAQGTMPGSPQRLAR